MKEGRKAYNVRLRRRINLNFGGFKGFFMGWRSKFIFLLIVYFAGFATAIYYLAPSGRETCQGYQAGSYSSSSDNESQSSGSVVVKDFCNKAYAKASVSLSNVDWQALKEKLNLSVQKLVEIAKNSRDSVEGAEDK
jgi:hypothetical protein